MPESTVGMGVAASAREKNIAGRSSHSRAKTKRINRAMAGVDRNSYSVARVASSSWPYGTPLGQTGSHALHPRH